MLALSLCIALAVMLALGVNRSIKPNVGATVLLAPVGVAATQANLTLYFDTQGYNSLMLVFAAGALTGAGAIAPGVVESDDHTTWTTVDPTQLDWSGSVGPNNANPAATGFTAGQTVRVGYLGNKRYVTGALTLLSGTSAIVGVTAIPGEPSQLPLS